MQLCGAQLVCSRRGSEVECGIFQLWTQLASAGIRKKTCCGEKYSSRALQSEKQKREIKLFGKVGQRGEDQAKKGPTFQISSHE